MTPSHPPNPNPVKLSLRGGGSSGHRKEARRRKFQRQEKIIHSPGRSSGLGSGSEGGGIKLPEDARGNRLVREHHDGEKGQISRTGMPSSGDDRRGYNDWDKDQKDTDMTESPITASAPRKAPRFIAFIGNPNQIPGWAQLSSVREEANGWFGVRGT